MLHLTVWRLSIHNFPDHGWSPSTRIVWNGRELCERNKDLAFPTEDPQPFPPDDTQSATTDNGQIPFNETQAPLPNGIQVPPSNGTQAPLSNGTQETTSGNTQPPSTDTNQAPPSNEPPPYHYDIAHPPPTWWPYDLEKAERLQPVTLTNISPHAIQMQPSAWHRTQRPGHVMQSPMDHAIPKTIGLLIIALRNGSVAHLGKNA